MISNSLLGERPLHYTGHNPAGALAIVALLGLIALTVGLGWAATVAKLPISGSYHEYAFGPVLAPNGNLRITLNVAFGGATQSPVPWRGWLMEIKRVLGT